MSRYTITVTGHGQSDPDAVIGYDPPLETFFLQAFPDAWGDNLALWLGTDHREFRTIECLHRAAVARGYRFLPLPPDISAKLAAEITEADAGPESEQPFAALLNQLRGQK